MSKEGEGEAGARGREGSEKPDMPLGQVVGTGPGLPVTRKGSASLQGVDEEPGGQAHVASAPLCGSRPGPSHSPHSSLILTH